MYRRAAPAPDSSKVYDETYVRSLRYAKNVVYVTTVTLPAVRRMYTKGSFAFERVAFERSATIHYRLMYTTFQLDAKGIQLPN